MSSNPVPVRVPERQPEAQVTPEKPAERTRRFVIKISQTIPC